MAETFINKTIETNQRFMKKQQQYAETITQVIKTCLEDHSINKINSLKTLLPAIEEVVVKESPICGYLMYILADSCRKCNLYEDSIHFGNQSLHIREILYGEDSNEVCICLDLLSLSMLEFYQYEQSSKVFLRSFKGKALGGYTTFSQLVLDINKFIVSITEQSSVLKKKLQLQQQKQQFKVNDILINTLVECNQCLQKIYFESLKDTSNQSQERTAEIRKALISLSMEQSKLQLNDKKYLNAIKTYQEILKILNNSGLKEEKLIYESLVLTYVKIEKYDQVKSTIDSFIQMGVKCYKVPSIDIASVLWFSGKVLEDQSDRASQTKLCDLVDALRYYLCTFKISREIGGVTIGEESTAVAQKKIREKIETILYNNRPLKPEEVLTLVDGMIRSTTTDFLLNGSKSQNWLLKYVYPDFMAEDALREKFDQLPTKTGFLFKMNGLMKSWKTRWFSVERDLLSYYKYNNDPKPQGELQILEIKSIEILPKDKKFKPYVHCFQLVHPKHTLILAAETEEVMKDWVNILNKAKQYWEDWSNISLSL
ncbi:hypothetical protein DICPUDRAFT_151224 [Dictyostelium purpureum]|uniref:PH domain-containing protein n=1 Tax=Dictyostelium purpureum TaxID=5786 RepID=F0ZIB1_DICPU|nr:uncharacterized protein DICPUDRAFT_151224 [Dictyostelium purpureum]EGC36344.1 hypothetical protein DICPUDRAFT_151224 [Dictyostelium purpureum]|eukprot:XP_003287159.1 hypothetical protein DICPUDRAFT_151224 [Dictyostelium purpureum]